MKCWKIRGKIFATVSLLFFFLVLLSGRSIIGYVVSDEVVETRIEKNFSTLEIKEPSKFLGNAISSNKNKRMDFEFGNGSVRIYFDLLNHRDFVNQISENKKILEESEDVQKKLRKIADESTTSADGFDIKVEDEFREHKYKWGYYVPLKELDFSAKIDVTSNLKIKIINDTAVQIGNSLLSFSDLEEQGYRVKIGLPDIESLEISNLTEENNTKIINDSTRESNLTEENSTEESDVAKEIVADENLSEEIPVNEVVVEEIQEAEEIHNQPITGSVIKLFSGFTSRVVKQVVSKEELFYENVVSVYIEKEFSPLEFEIGQIIYLDPTLEVIEISDAAHLDSDRIFIGDVYEQVKEKDDEWVLISEGEYLRVSFEENLTREKDITIYARAGDSAEVKVYRQNGDEEIAKFENITTEDYYKIYLTGLGEDEFVETFDLKSFGDVEYDYVVDPSGDTNTWICSSSQLWSNASCWSLGSVPVAGENVVFDNAGTGWCNITNNTMSQNLNSFVVKPSYTGRIYFAPLFAVGNWGDYVGTQEWNVTNDINISGGTSYIYGDAFNSSTLAWMVNAGLTGMYNITAEGHGQVWRSLDGNIIVGNGAVVDGVGLGFFKVYPQGIVAGHGGMRNSYTQGTYGNFSAPTSLGSGGSESPHFGAGGGSIKLSAKNIISLDGIINMSGQYSRAAGAGGSIWLIAEKIALNGIACASGGGSDLSHGGGGGRIRIDFDELDYNGIINVGGGNTGSSDLGKKGRQGTFSWGNKQGETNYTWNGNLILNNSIGLAAGEYNINGDLLIPSGNVLGVHPLNETALDNGTGVSINVKGNVTVEFGGSIDGDVEGFRGGYGPGYTGGRGGTHGGRGGDNTKDPYGSSIYPISLGSGAASSPYSVSGGGAIKLNATGFILLDGAITAKGQNGRPAGAGGSIWLIAENIIGTGNITSGGGIQTYNPQRGGAGGRIALHSEIINFSGLLYNEGGFGSTSWGSGGTVYINATTIYNLGNINVVGFNGSSAGSDWGQRITINGKDTTLANRYNASNFGIANTIDGEIYVNYCFLSDGSATYQPNAVKTEREDCDVDTTAPTIYTHSPQNTTYYDSQIWFNATADEEIDAWIVNYNETNITIDINTFLEVELGTHHLFLYANDTSGNWGVNDSIWFSVAQAPKIGLSILHPPQNINITQNQFFNVTLNVSCLQGSCGASNISLYSSGLIPVNSGTPFYTNASSNPLTTSSLSAGQSETINFWVNATGDEDTTHTFFAFANLTSDLSISNQTTKWNVTILSAEEGIAISFSDKLADKINWTISSLPMFNKSAEGNNDDGQTNYYINISTLSVGVDVYIKANSDLMTSDFDILGISNQTFSYSHDNPLVPSQTKYPLTTNYDNKIGDNLGDSSVIYLKFFLNAPAAQPAGNYNNSLMFKAVPHGQTP